MGFCITYKQLRSSSIPMGTVLLECRLFLQVWGIFCLFLAWSGTVCQYFLKDWFFLPSQYPDKSWMKEQGCGNGFHAGMAPALNFSRPGVVRLPVLTVTEVQFVSTVQSPGHRHKSAGSCAWPSSSWDLYCLCYRPKVPGERSCSFVLLDVSQENFLHFSKLITGLMWAHLSSSRLSGLFTWYNDGN